MGAWRDRRSQKKSINTRRPEIRSVLACLSTRRQQESRERQYDSRRPRLLEANGHRRHWHSPSYQPRLMHFPLLTNTNVTILSLQYNHPPTYRIWTSSHHRFVAGVGGVTLVVRAWGFRIRSHHIIGSHSTERRRVIGLVERS